MNRARWSWGLSIGVLAAALLLNVSPADAQFVGALTGRIVDEAGKPVADVQVDFVFEGEMPLKSTTKTNAKGEWTMGGLQATGGTWMITARKDALLGRATNVAVPGRGTTAVPDIVLKSASATSVGGGGGVDPKLVADADPKIRGELLKMISEADAAFKANDFDTTIAKLTEVTKSTKCFECNMLLGDAYIKKTDLANAEKAFTKAAEANDKLPEAYEALANVYNGQRKFDEAAKASEKANAIRTAAAAASPGGAVAAANPTSVFNQGAIAFNASKMDDAKAHFLKAIELKPDYADAYYYLGMVSINQGNMPDAKKHLEQYLKLAPTGENAVTAKAVLESLPK